MTKPRKPKRPPRKNRAPDPSRNLHIPRGAAVTVAEVIKHALKHAKCQGGLVPGSKTTPCVCATRRFLKAHPEVIMDKAGSAWWPAEDPLTQTKGPTP